MIVECIINIIWHLLDNSCSFFKFPILNIAEGLALEMCPRSCQLGGAAGSGQLQYTMPTVHGGSGASPVRKTTAWLIVSASVIVTKNWVSDIGAKSVCTWNNYSHLKDPSFKTNIIQNKVITTHQATWYNNPENIRH